MGYEDTERTNEVENIHILAPRLSQSRSYIRKSLHEACNM